MREGVYRILSTYGPQTTILEREDLEGAYFVFCNYFQIVVWEAWTLVASSQKMKWIFD